MGEVVFNMIDCGLLHSRPEDSRDEFAGVFQFEEAFDLASGIAIPWDDLRWER